MGIGGISKDFGDGRDLDWGSITAGPCGLAHRPAAPRRVSRVGLPVRGARYGARTAARRPRPCRRAATAVRCGVEAPHQDAAALRGVGHGDLASAAYRHHRRRRGSDRRLAGSGPGPRVGRQFWFLEHGACGEGARWQSRAPGRARPRCHRHAHRAGRRGRGPACIRQPRNAVALRAVATASAVRAPGDRLAAATLRPRRALGAVRRRARDRQRRGVRGARFERRARRTACSA